MMATLMAIMATRAIRGATLSLYCRRPYEKVLQSCWTRAASQADMTCGIQHELRKVVRLAMLPKLLRYIEPKFDKSLRMGQHVGDLSCQVILFEAIAKHLGVRELLLEETLFVGQAQRAEAKSPHRTVMGSALRIWRHIDDP